MTFDEGVSLLWLSGEPMIRVQRHCNSRQSPARVAFIYDTLDRMEEAFGMPLIPLVQASRNWEPRS